MEAPTTPTEFNPEQKRYLEGFMSGLQIARAARAVPASANRTGAVAAPAAEPTGPDADHLRAQDRFVKEGKKLSDPEKFKRELHPFDGYERLKAQAANNEPPKADDNFRWRFYGLFYCAPNQAAYMCRLRIPNGILKHWQFAGVGDLAERYAGGYAHVTTRANLQMREVEPKNAVAIIEAVQDLGLCSRGSGADNIRNVTGTPTAGIDPQELIDTRAYAREWHFHILNDRSLYDIPRKGTPQIRDRCMGHRQLPERDGGKARPQARAGSGRSNRPTVSLRPRGPCGHASAEAARPELDRRGASGRQAHRRPDARAGCHRARLWRRRHPADGVAEPADLGHSH